MDNMHVNTVKLHRVWNRKSVTFEFVEDSPEFSNVSGKRDVCVQDDDPLQVRWQRLSEHKLHQAIDSRVMFVGDPWHLRLKHHINAKLETFAVKLTELKKKMVSKAHKLSIELKKVEVRSLGSAV